MTIFDYVDVLVPMLAKMHQKRLHGYAAIGYSVAPRNGYTYAGFERSPYARERETARPVAGAKVNLQGLSDFCAPTP